MKATEITKGSTLLATLNEDNFPFGMHKDLIDDLHRMINVALTIPIVICCVCETPTPEKIHGIIKACTTCKKAIK